MAHEKTPTRRYRLKKRAQTMAQTRQRIAEAAVELHGTVGPARTTMSAVAERAGVQRHTLYRHFPTEADLFGACSAHFFTENPLPDLASWREITDPVRRLSQALDELYAYYERTEQMLSNVLRDAELVEALRPTLVPMENFFTNAVDILAGGWGARGKRRRLLAAALYHAMNFHTWHSLAADNQLTRAETVELATAMVEAAAAPRMRASSAS